MRRGGRSSRWSSATRRGVCGWGWVFSPCREPLHALQFAGLVIAVAGAVIITVTRPRDFGDWRSWALLLPLGGALLRGVVPPIVKLGLEIWPSPLWACLIGYMMSSLVVLTVEPVRN